MLLCKGADSAVLEKVNDGADLDTVDCHLTDYAKVSIVLYLLFAVCLSPPYCPGNLSSVFVTARAAFNPRIG